MMMRHWIDFLDQPVNRRFFVPYTPFYNKLRKFTWKEFERLVSDLFQKLGADAEIHPPGPNDTIDILLDGDYIVQCKNWKVKVGVPAVKEVYGTAVERQARGAIIVAVGEFTKNAHRFARDLRPPPVRLIDGIDLFNLMNKHMPTVVADIRDGRWKSEDKDDTTP